MDNWNDLRLVLAISKSGSLKAAATELGHNHSTLFRWLNDLEERLDVKLFERSSGRYTLTSAGERMVEAARRVEIEMVALDREIAGADARLSGQLKVTSSETIAYRILNDIIAEFHRTHPGIEIELIVDNRQLDLSRREAEVAIRATRPTEGDLFGRKVADTAWTIYGSRNYLASHPVPVSLDSVVDHEFIGWDLEASAAAAKWIEASIARSTIIYRSSSLINQLMAAKAGIGLVLLPCYLGDGEADIERVIDPIVELTRELWIITHQDLKKTGRVRAFFDIVGNALLARRSLLEGTAP
jgi:DNA-binding transcriptional LysR family regulator